MALGSEWPGGRALWQIVQRPRRTHAVGLGSVPAEDDAASDDEHDSRIGVDGTAKVGEVVFEQALAIDAHDAWVAIGVGVDSSPCGVMSGPSPQRRHKRGQVRMVGALMAVTCTSHAHLFHRKVGCLEERSGR
jgi:hypothetical protein